MKPMIATITKIENVENLHIVTFDFFGEVLKMMSLDLREDVRVGKQVALTVKPTHLLLAKEFSGDLSLTNKIQGKVLSCENGKLLSVVKVALKESVLESIMILEASLLMKIKVDDAVTIMIAESELSIVKVL